MGKIIVKNIKGIGWKTRIGLISVFTLVFSVLIYQGWNQLRSASAAVIRQANWTSQYAGTAFPNGAVNPNYTIAAGSNRLLVVAIASTTTAAATRTINVTYGGQALTLASGDSTVSKTNHTALYYLKNAGIQAATGTSLNVTISGGTTYYHYVYAAVYSNVDQGATYTVANYNNAAANSAVGPFNPTLAIGANDQAIEVINLARSAAGTTARLIGTWATGWTTAGIELVYNAVNGPCLSLYIRDRAIPASLTNDGSQHTAGSTSTYDSMTALVIKAATTTLGNGTDIASANVAPGAASQKLDGFSFVTSSAATTDSVTGLTVTTTNPTAIASMSIWNEAGTTQYFATVNNPTASTAFSGGTAIPVTSTATSYKILVTYKDRATAPAGNSATSANVTAYTCANIQATGTDAAGTTLTLLNTHAASTWGTNTPGDSQVILNWTKGTPTQSVIVVRYGANSDTTKPVDAVSYGTGAALGTGTVVYNGAASTYTNTGLTNGSSYYYKIFEYDALNYYYNASDVWTAALSPVSPDAVAPTVNAGFAATTPVNSTTIPITSLSATDNGGGSGVSGYLITTNSTQPLVGSIPSGAPPTSFTVAGEGSYTLYPWAKDAGGNVSPLYASPVVVVVDLSAPTIGAFSAPAQSSSSSITISSFTGNDTGGSGIAGYMITESNSAPLPNNPAWSGSPPASYTVPVDGAYTLWPWVKDAAGNVSAYSSQVGVLVDTTAPAGLALTSPADEAVAIPLNLALLCTTATDAGSGGVQYWFQISNDGGYAQNSGWIAGNSFSPTGLEQGFTYLWSVKAKDALGNETAFTAPRTFTTTAPCVRNNPTLLLLTAGGSKASTISTEAGSAPYNLTVMNNDFGDCGPTTFNLSLTDEDSLGHFDPSTLSSSSVLLNPGAESTLTVTAIATPAEDSGILNTTATAAADAFHSSITSGRVQTTLNVVTCRPNPPLLIVGPDSGYVNKNGKFVYTITVKNTDTGSGCLPVTYDLTKVSDSNAVSFIPSVLSLSSMVLGAGELSSATLTVTAKTDGLRDAVNATILHLAAPGHTSPTDVTVQTTINNPMLHNSDNTGSSKWSVSGGWGTPNGRYGEIDCNTCHVGGGGDTTNVKRTNVAIFTPSTTLHQHFPGEGQAVAYRRYEGASATNPVLGWDGSATPRTASTKICEVCHTYDAAGTNGVKAHPYSTSGATLDNHFDTDGTDCTRCHKHNKGFAGATGMCNTCHGDDSFTGQINELNRYYVAPPKNRAGVTGTLSGTNQVSNDPVVGAHQTHLRSTIGFNSYSTIDFRCANCHGPVPTGTAHASDSTPGPVFQGMAARGGMSPTFTAGTLTCANTYCHNPAASTVLKKTTNTGSGVFPSWTSAQLFGDTRKTQANCGVCHKSPGDAGFDSGGGLHTGMTIANQSCTGCHGHDGDSQGTVGRRHMDGKLFGAGACNSCHGYLASSWATAPVINAGGAGAHAMHITYLTTKLNTISLNPDGDSYGSAGTAWVNVCGICHDNVSDKHMDNTVDVKLSSTYFFGSAGSATYTGTPGGAGAKSCSNLSCHYFTTPLWSN